MERWIKRVKERDYIPPSLPLLSLLFFPLLLFLSLSLPYAPMLPSISLNRLKDHPQPHLFLHSFSLQLSITLCLFLYLSLLFSLSLYVSHSLSLFLSLPMYVSLSLSLSVSLSLPSLFLPFLLPLHVSQCSFSISGTSSSSCCCCWLCRQPCCCVRGYHCICCWWLAR